MKLAKLDALIAAHAWDTSFFEVVRLVRQVLAKDPSTRLELVHVPDLKFPMSDVVASEIDGSVLRVRCSFFGLLGTTTPLALHFTEQVLHQDPEGALRDLYGVIHHALLEALFASWRDATLAGALDAQTSSVLTRRIATYAAIDWASSDEFPANAVRCLSDYQRGQPQTMDGASATSFLQRIFPALPLSVEFGHPMFVPFAEHEMAMLGERNTELGVDLVYGAGLVDRAATVRIVVGVVPLATLEWLMPSAVGFDALLALVPRLFGIGSDVELDVLLAPEDMPRVELGGEGGSDLGTSAWIASEEASRVRVRIPLREAASALDCEFIEER